MSLHLHMVDMLGECSRHRQAVPDNKLLRNPRQLVVCLRSRLNQAAHPHRMTCIGLKKL